MPVMDGLCATRQLRERGLTTPILALTALSTPADRERCFAAGCSAFLAKPVNLDELTRTVGSLVAQAVHRDARAA